MGLKGIWRTWHRIKCRRSAWSGWWVTLANAQCLQLMPRARLFGIISKRRFATSTVATTNANSQGTKSGVGESPGMVFGSLILSARHLTPAQLGPKAGWIMTNATRPETANDSSMWTRSLSQPRRSMWKWWLARKYGGFCFR